MKLICIASLSIIGVLSQTDCSYGGFDWVNGKCMFNCEYQGNYVEISTLSFDLIKDECSDISRAAALFPNDCNSLDDLVYSDTTCRCPYCKCSTQDLDGEIETLLSYGPSQVCLNCTCSNDAVANTYYGIEEMVYDCDYLYGTSDPINWNNYQCPPETCMRTTGGNEYEASSGSYWWEDVSSATLCTEFCYCSPKVGKICATGYDNILANDVLTEQFHRDCGNYYDAAAVKLLCIYITHRTLFVLSIQTKQKKKKVL